MRVAVAIDDAPKVRIALAVVLAFLLWFVFLLKLGEWLGTPSAAPIADRPLEMRVVELEPSVAAPVGKTARTAPAPAASPRPPKPVEPPRRSLPQHAAPAIKSNPEKQSATPSATSSGDTAARSISQPLPELPGDLREQAYQTIATARFVIHVDGSVDVELIKPTPNPRLNQILLQALRKWRYSPAIQGGHPVETRQDVRVHFNV